LNLDGSIRMSLVLLCHPACSGGSLIYRLLVAGFPVLGVSEIGHALPLPPQGFHPLDPEAQLYARGEMSYAQFGDSLRERIGRCVQIAAARNQRLLLREHTHGYLFAPAAPERIPTTFSWYLDQLSPDQRAEVPSIVSLRDPIDTWLGLRWNFPADPPHQFAEYCDCYLRLLDRVDACRSGKVEVVKYEEVVATPERFFERVSRLLGIAASPDAIEQFAQVEVTGDSGRSSGRLGLRKRRPFTSDFIRTVEATPAYTQLVQRLGYPHFLSRLTWRTKTGAILRMCVKHTTAWPDPAYRRLRGKSPRLPKIP
jgi:hypothetical protein